MIRVKKVNSNFEREPLSVPFGFKGEYIRELWQTVSLLESESGLYGMGLGVQSVLWSDSSVFDSLGDLGGNNLMFLMTRYGLKEAVKIPFGNPAELLEQLLPETLKYGKKISGNPNLRMTFALNSLVPVDNAAWMLYSRENNIWDFDSMLPAEYKDTFNCKNSKLAGIPLITYGMDMKEVKRLLDEGYFFLKIKIGCDPGKDGDREKMLEWDKERLLQIHNIAKNYCTPYTESGHPVYYLDANGRYDNRDRLLSFLEYARKINALDSIVLLEEPFPEEYRIDVGDMPVRIAADESAHSDTDAIERIQMGYKAITLKPIAKTLSMSLKIAKAAYERKIPCFCADLTVNPVMVDINKCMAARLSPIPGVKTGVLESNGGQYYTGWDRMKSYHPYDGALWTEARDGLYELDDCFYKASGGIFKESSHYLKLVK